MFGYKVPLQQLFLLTRSLQGSHCIQRLNQFGHHARRQPPWQHWPCKGLQVPPFLTQP
eukprot:UN12618